VEGNVLGQWVTPVPEGDGLYEIRVLVKSGSASADPSVPPGHLAGNTVKVMVDNTPPNAEISLDTGPCANYYTNGAPINGRFTATDDHIRYYNLMLTPYNNPPIISPSGASYPALLPPGEINKTFAINTANTTPCGYVVHLSVWDRAILNNHLQGNYTRAYVGFCLLEAAK